MDYAFEDFFGGSTMTTDLQRLAERAETIVHELGLELDDGNVEYVCELLEKTMTEAYTRAAEVARTKFWEAHSQIIPAEEWLAAAIERLRDEK
jgi:hypothetical protein